MLTMLISDPRPPELAPPVVCRQWSALSAGHIYIIRMGLTPVICDLSINLMMVPAAPLMASCLPPEAAPPDLSNS